MGGLACTCTHRELFVHLRPSNSTMFYVRGLLKRARSLPDIPDPTSGHSWSAHGATFVAKIPRLEHSMLERGRQQASIKLVSVGLRLLSKTANLTPSYTMRSSLEMLVQSQPSRIARRLPFSAVRPSLLGLPTLLLGTGAPTSRELNLRLRLFVSTALDTNGLALQFLESFQSSWSSLCSGDKQ